MKIIDESTLDLFRRSRHCEICGVPTPGGCQAHHAVVRRGFGGGSRLDVPMNCLACCAPCHDAAHRGMITRAYCIAVIAKREGVTPDQVLETVYRLLRERKP